MSTKIDPGQSQTVRVPSTLLDIPDLIARLRKDIEEARPTVSFIMVHNKTKTAKVEISFNQGTMHVAVTDPDELYRFTMKESCKHPGILSGVCPYCQTTVITNAVQTEPGA